MRVFTCRDVEALPVDGKAVGSLIDGEGVAFSLERGRPAHHLLPSGIRPNIGGRKENDSKGTKKHQITGKKMGRG